MMWEQGGEFQHWGNGSGGKKMATKMHNTHESATSLLLRKKKLLGKVVSYGNRMLCLQGKYLKTTP